MPPKKPVQPVPKGKVVNKKPPTVNKNAKVQPASKGILKYKKLFLYLIIIIIIIIKL